METGHATGRLAKAVLLSSISAGTIIYSLGFLAWSSYFRSLDLGFHVLPAQRYLLVGLLFALILFPMLWLETVYYRKGWLDRLKEFDTPSLWLQAALCGGRFVFFVFVFQTTLTLTSEIIDITELASWFIAIAVGIIAPATWLFVSILGWAFRFVRDGLKALLEKTRLGEIPISEQTAALLPKLPARITLGAAMVLWIFLGATMFGWLLLDRVTPEYGGAMARQARIAVHPDDLPPDLEQHLLEQGHDRNKTSWSRPISLLLLTESDLMFRISGVDPDPLYQLPKETVRAIQWEQSVSS